MFDTKRLPVPYDVLAPDGSEVRVLLGLKGGSMAHFRLGPGETSAAVVHRTVEEIWYVLAGKGEMWRRMGDREETVVLDAGVCLTIPLGTSFQFRAAAGEGVEAVAVTLPPWPGEGEAVRAEGPWPRIRPSAQERRQSLHSAGQ